MIFATKYFLINIYRHCDMDRGMLKVLPKKKSLFKDGDKNNFSNKRLMFIAIILFPDVIYIQLSCDVDWYLFMECNIYL